MKLSFSTLGCPDWSIDEVVKYAKKYGFAGVEIRGIKSDLDIRKSPAFSDEQISQTKELFQKAGIEIVSIDSSARLFSLEKEELKINVQEAKDYITLANKLEVPLIRVFGGFVPENIDFKKAKEQLAKTLSELGDFAQKINVIIALETHDSFLTGKDVAEVMKLTNHKSIGVVWDISNCFWTGEPIEKTAEFLAPYIKLVHIKDSVWIGKEAKLTFIGEGKMPIFEVLKILTNIGYPGYLSYEWEKVWQPDLAEPELAFPQYVGKMNEYLGKI